MEHLSFLQMDWPQKISCQNAYDNFARLYGIRLAEYAPGFARLEMRIQPLHLNSQLRMHGSWSAALIMIAAGKAARSRGFEARPCKLNMNYYNGVREGVLQITAREKQGGGRLASFDVDIVCHGDHSVNGDEVQSAHAAERPVLVSAGRVDFLPLDEPVGYAELDPPDCPHRVRAPLPVYPPGPAAGLHDDVPGLRPCFMDSDWPAKLAYMNENENLYYNEGFRMTEYGPGFGSARMETLPQHLDAYGRLDPAWLAVFLDPLIGKPSLHTGRFCVTAQSSITFFEAAGEPVACLSGSARRISSEGHFAVYQGSVYNERRQELAMGVCTMYLRSAEINFCRELPLDRT